MTDEEFRELVEPHRRELLAHCYRILGAVHDAEDALQDALVRAWRGLASFEGRSTLRRWLYTIATRASLDIAEKRRARSLPLLEVAPTDVVTEFPAPATEGAWIEPIPSDVIPDDAPGPEARVSARESVAFAFLAVMQTLPPRQRAALVLRDVAGYSAIETAEILELSVAAANSALQRARDALASRPAIQPDSTIDPGLLERFITACETRDADALVALLVPDAAFSMPPFPLWVRGTDAIRAFARDVLFTVPTMRDQRLAIVPGGANGLPAVAAYARDATGAFAPVALDVLVIRGGKIAELHAFLAIGGFIDLARFPHPRA